MLLNHLHSCRQRLLMLSAVLLIFLSQALTAESEERPQSVNLEDLRAFTEVYTRLRDQYYGSVDQQLIFQHAITGMLAEVDPYSSYLTSAEYARLNETSSGVYAGIGVEISSADFRLKITGVIADSPAEEAGIKAGDIITAVNNQAVKGRLINASLEDLRGESDSRVSIETLRQASASDKALSQRYELVRRVVHYNEISSRRLVEDFLYLQIKSFQHNTARELQTEISAQLKRSAIPGLILDLRDNPGGVLNSGVAVADHFMQKGLIVTTKTRGETEDLRFSANREQLLTGIPIVVLVNSSTASAAEILAGALKDNHRATIVGEKTFGKGSVQTIFPLANGAALKLTTAHYYTPSGQVIHKHGIEPDVVVADEFEGADNDPVLAAGVEVLWGL
ncbi:MAG: S41 family peptidase [Xanthomonadales bacterium]|nr:S41 family peptidase [Xanthomonadales bacterium]